MNETMLTLKPDVTLTERDGQVGLTLHGHARFAKDARQTKILRALVLQSQSLESLISLLHARDDPFQNDNYISLAMAEFILDFGDFLEA